MKTTQYIKARTGKYRNTKSPRVQSPLIKIREKLKSSVGDKHSESLLKTMIEYMETKGKEEFRNLDNWLKSQEESEKENMEELLIRIHEKLKHSSDKLDLNLAWKISWYIHEKAAAVDLVIHDKTEGCL